MQLRSLLVVVVLASSVSMVITQNGDNSSRDPLGPLITFLRQLQRLRELYTNGISRTVNGLSNSVQGALPRPESQAAVPLSSNAIDGENSSNSGTSGQTGPAISPLATLIQNFRLSRILNNLFNRNSRRDSSAMSPLTLSNLLNSLIFNRLFSDNVQNQQSASL